MADDTKPFSQIVREYGQRQSDNAITHADLWKAWAEQLGELIRDIPPRVTPCAYDEDGDRSQVDMGAQDVQPLAMRTRLYGVIADADALAAALIRAGVLAENQCDELANKLACEECTGCGWMSYACSWSQTSVAGPGDCCDDCSHAGDVDEASPPASAKPDVCEHAEDQSLCELPHPPAVTHG